MPLGKFIAPPCIVLFLSINPFYFYVISGKLRKGLCKKRLETCLNRENPQQKQRYRNKWTTKCSALIEDHSVPNRIQPRNQSGIYMIHCLENDWRYYGESSNVSGRLASHKSLLNRQIHPNKLLQADWNQYGLSNFQFIPLFLGEKWSDPVIRRGKELELIILNRNISYNVLEGIQKPGDKNPFWGKTHSEETKKRIGDSMKGIPNDLLGKKISIHNVQYQSIAEASRQTGHSRKLIRNRLNDPSWLDWIILN
jgi:hypothetical protein